MYQTATLSRVGNSLLADPLYPTALVIEYNVDVTTISTNYTLHNLSKYEARHNITLIVGRVFISPPGSIALGSQ